MKVDIEYVIYNLESGEIKDAVEQVKNSMNKKFGYNSWYEVHEKANIELLDKLKDITKKGWVEGKRVAYYCRKKNCIERKV